VQAAFDGLDQHAGTIIGNYSSATGPR
jgi:hypothetical protein